MYIYVYYWTLVTQCIMASALGAKAQIATIRMINCYDLTSY